MGTIRFVAPGFSRAVAYDPASSPRRTLLAIARDHGIPILFNCEAGGCAACIVHVEPAPDAPPPVLSFEEHFLLDAMGRLHDRPEGDGAGARPGFRLACQYVVGDEDIRVDFAEGTSGA